VTPVVSTPAASNVLSEASAAVLGGGETESYPGSKAGSGVWQRIISLMPRHQNYFELFLGHGVILRRKLPAPGLNVGADVDPNVIAWWLRGWERRPLSPSMTILQEDALRILSSHVAMADPGTLVYIDPPYLAEVRTKLYYDYEFQDPFHHAMLLAAIRRLPCRVMISGYASPLYAKVLHDWRVESFNAMTRGGLRREHVWMNFPTDLPLHDTRWAGDGFRERERIRKKRDRWRRMFSQMAPHERQVIAQALLVDASPSPARTPAALASITADGEVADRRSPIAAGGEDSREGLATEWGTDSHR